MLLLMKYCVDKKFRRNVLRTKCWVDEKFSTTICRPTTWLPVVVNIQYFQRWSAFIIQSFDESFRSQSMNYNEFRSHSSLKTSLFLNSEHWNGPYNMFFSLSQTRLILLLRSFYYRVLIVLQYVFLSFTNSVYTVIKIILRPITYLLTMSFSLFHKLGLYRYQDHFTD